MLRPRVQAEPAARRRPRCTSTAARRAFHVAVGGAISAALVLGSTEARAAATWVKAPPNPASGGQAFGLWLMTDGSVLSHGAALNDWILLTPDKKGSYANGTWKSVASSTYSRGGAQEHVLKDGRFLEAGGEYIYVYPGCSSNCSQPASGSPLFKNVEIYDPVADKWTVEASAPSDIGDTGSATLADGRILDSSRENTNTQIYDPATNMWTTGPTIPTGNGDENAWASLQNGGVLAVGYQNAGGAIYNPASNTWQKTGPVPSGFNTGDTGGISLMFDGRVLVYGLGQMYIYTPGATAADPGTWALGPKALNGDRAEDEYSDALPNGKVWGALVTMTYGPGVVLQEFDPKTNTVTSVPPPPDTGNPYPIDYVNLPNGQVMVTAANNDWIATLDSPPDDAWRPTVTSVTYGGNNTYTLTGTQISGLISGADEGDDMTMAENYPIVFLTDEAGDVYYCRSFNFSNMMPSPGSTPETCQFTTPAGLPAGTYDLYVSAVGVQSKDPVKFTTGMGGMGSASGGDAGAASDAAVGEGGAGSTTGGSSGASASSGGGSTGGSGSTAGGGESGSTGASGGAGSAGGLGDGGAGSSGAGNGAAPGAGAARDSSGCGCETVGSSRGFPARGAMAALVGLALAARLRWRRRARG